MKADVATLCHVMPEPKICVDVTQSVGRIEKVLATENTEFTEREEVIWISELEQ